MSASRKAYLCLGVSGIAVLSTGAAWSQNPPAPPVVPEQVLITGSLLSATNFAAPTPVTQISAIQVETRSLTGIGTLVEELPFAQTGQGLTRNTNGIVAAAQSLPNLRGLGSNDTLVLIDGQRPTPVNPTNNFDTDMIPASLIDRFEVVTTGASASYGSDAVAGVVNFILKNRLEGFTSNAQIGTSQRGDENQRMFSAAYGTAFAGGRGHFIIGGEYADQYQTVNMYARDWGRLEPGLVSLPTTRAAGLPANLLSNNAEVDNATEGGLITGGSPAAAAASLKNIAFGNGAAPYNFQFGTPAGTSYMVGTGNYGVSSLNRQLSPPYKRWAALARAEFDITPSVNAYLTLNYGQLESNDPSGGSPFPVVFTIASGNPFIPATIQAQMTAKGVQNITLAKEHLNGLKQIGNTADNKNTLLQSFFGLKGSLSDNWNWNLQGSAGRALVWQTFTNVPVTANLNAASYVVKDANGTPVCGPAATNPMFNAVSDPVARAALIAQTYPGCVPYNPFGVDTVNQSAIDYINNTTRGVDGSKNNIRQYMVTADVTGTAFELPAGDVAVAVGANWRYNSFFQLGNAATNAGVFNTRNPPTFGIHQSVWESYGELGVPVVKDLPFALSADLNAAARYTHYSISGGATTWKFGGTWDVNEMIRLRATRSQDIRAPNFTEIADVPTSSATNIQNPISGFSQRVSNIQTTGNPNLKPEVAQNFTAGVVFQPTFSWLTGFRASVDYYRIKISGQIAAVTAQEVLNRCLLQNLPEFCSQVEFSGSDVKTTFGVSNFHLHSVNLNSQLQDGYDINISERLPIDLLGLPGTFDISALASYINQQRIIQTQSNGSISDINFADTWSAPRWSTNLNFTYNLDRLTAGVQMRYYSPIKFTVAAFSTLFIGPEEPTYDPANPLSINRNVWPAAVTWNLRLAYDVIKRDNGENLQVYFNVDNVLDKNPPIIWWWVSTYDVVGRYFKIGLRYTTP
jgi:outer membrane receptor protein involved in Fe transport